MQQIRSNKLTNPMERVERKIGQPLGEYLRQRYECDGLTTTEIATELGIHAVTVTRWMEHFGIDRRFPGQRGTAV